MASLVGHYLSYKTWSIAPITKFCHPLRTLSALRTQSQSTQGLRVPPLDNAIFRPTLHLPNSRVYINVGSPKTWRATPIMSLIAPESGCMLFYTLTACAAVAQVSFTILFSKYLQWKLWGPCSVGDNFLLYLHCSL